MEHELIATIMYIKSVSKNKPPINRIKTHLLKHGDGNSVWSIDNLPYSSQDMSDKCFIDLAGGAYKVKQTQVRKLVDETPPKLTS